jgi:CheY-like chemotaxis protein
LLVVDADLLVRRMLCKKLAHLFDEVIAAADPFEAEQALKEKRITHLVCDIPPDGGLLSKWRKEYPSIVCAVLFLASAGTQRTGHKGADSLLSKDEGLAELIWVLGRPRA